MAASRLGAARGIALVCLLRHANNGIALPGTLFGAELMRRRKPGRFVMLMLGVFTVFAIVQSVLLTSPKGYMAVAHFSTTSVWKTLQAMQSRCRMRGKTDSARQYKVD